MKKVVLDTNVLLVSISTKSKLHWIFKNLLEGNYILCITTEILAEYAEIIDQQMGSLASESALGLLENLPNVALITNYYKFKLLKDPDDNKFVDCAISSNADFSILKKIEFPKVTIINTLEFKALFE